MDIKDKMTEIPQEIIESLRPLYAEAEEKGLWFCSRHQTLWFSPSELRQAQENGSFRWGAWNWELRDPKERLEELRHEIATAIKAAADFEKRMKESR